jgi:hypothetical protein
MYVTLNLYTELVSVCHTEPMLVYVTLNLYTELVSVCHTESVH